MINFTDKFVIMKIENSLTMRLLILENDRTADWKWSAVSLHPSDQAPALILSVA